jgi:hypothetical protein
VGAGEASSLLEDSLVVWILFRDKGLFTPAELDRARQTYEAGLPDRTIRRLQKARGPAPLVGYEDLPVCQGYRDFLIKKGIELRATTRWFNGVSARVPVKRLAEIAGLPFVRDVVPVSRRIPRLPDALPGPVLPGPELEYGPSYDQLAQIRVPEVHGRDITGEGVVVGMLDTGFDRSHQALQGVSVLAEWDFIHDDANTANEPGDDPWQDWHGTITLSVLGGYYPGQLIGVAYGAEYLLAKTEEVTFEEPIEEDWWVEGIEWLDSLGADVVSSSLGYRDWYTYEWMNGDSCVTTRAADIAASHGIVVCDAMGNHGNEPGSIIAPADADSIVAVGAVDRWGSLAEFSSVGPTYDGRIKPEVVAQGVDDYAADPNNPSGYLYVNGTSLSTPLIAGCAALILEANPTWTGQEVRDALRFTASQSSTPDNFLGWGIANALAAVDFHLLGLTVIPDTTVVRPGEILGYQVTLINNTEQPERTEAWSEVTLPNSRIRQVIRPHSVPLAPRDTVSRHLDHTVPASAPPGRYTYCVRAGAFPDRIVCDDCFEFEVVNP